MQIGTQENRSGLAQAMAGRPLASRHWMAVAVGLCVIVQPLRTCAQLASDPASEETKLAHDNALLEAWDKIGVRIKDGESWDVLGADLRAAIEQNHLSEHVGRCQQLLASIDAVIKSPPPDHGVTEQYEVAELIQALPRTTILHRLAIVPNFYYESVDQFVWDYYSRRRVTFDPDPAMVLYARGPMVIDPLIESLNDLRATRSVGTSEEGYRTPVVVRVCDVALALIESLSGCTFRETSHAKPLTSEWSADERNALEQSIRKWRRETKSLPLPEAIVWQIEHGPEKLRIQMIDTLIARKQHDVALSYLQKVYEQGAGSDLPQIANRLVQAGSREPLDHIHRLVAEGKGIQRDMVLLIAHYGEPRDFQLLVRLVESSEPNTSRGSANLVQMIVESLRAAKDSQAMLAVPVHVAVIREMQDDWSVLLESSSPRHAFPPILDMSIYAIQRATGLGFGVNDESETFDRARGAKAILTWWEGEGEGAYGLEQNKPHAPVGIR